MPTNSSEGRRAAQASAAPMENDQTERDASLRKVEARDLVEFGMIPVCVTYFKIKMNLNRNHELTSYCQFSRNSLVVFRF